MAPEPLTAREMTVLDIAMRYDGCSHPGAQEMAVLRTLQCSMTTYARMLNNLLDKQAALAAYPLLINRLRRIRDERMAQRGHAT